MNYHSEMIKKMATDIRNEISDGYLFGAKIDVNNQDEIIVAAYLMGEGKERSEHLRQSQLLKGLIVNNA